MRKYGVPHLRFYPSISTENRKVTGSTPVGATSPDPCNSGDRGFFVCPFRAAWVGADKPKYKPLVRIDNHSGGHDSSTRSVSTDAVTLSSSAASTQQSVQQATACSLCSGISRCATTARISRSTGAG